MAHDSPVAPDSNVVEALSFATQFLTPLQQGKADEAWDSILTDSPLRAQTSGVEESKKQAQTQLASIGAILDFTLLASREAATSPPGRRAQRPNSDRWVEKGGKVQNHPDGRVTDTDKSGRSVTYSREGFRTSERLDT